MPNIFRQAYIHFIFAVKFREQLIMPSFSDELEKILKDFEVEHDEHYLFKWIFEEDKKE
ncbi:MAG: hypothetical protein HF314_10565 [Ignavibacteria bacterium]|jgi:hypothetical protein|nr:hypothetical protein [Ignavibacteria bacterium]MCU7503508.1 hypothetical protein [Ignavibacteria bacterium]MCU7517254.1 hypothetical protein [Ignavibacteria bacterium]